MSSLKFSYYDDPVRTGALVQEEGTCSCCGEERDLFYDLIDTLHFQFEWQDVGDICAWCIADGSAARDFDVRFNLASSLSERVLPAAVIEEIECRTPAYFSWQPPLWLCHCRDACVFHGDLSNEEAASPDWQAVAFLFDVPLDEAKSAWKAVRHQYVAADPSIFKFVCRGCSQVFYQLDTP